VSSAAHLGARGPRIAAALAEAGVDALEAIHPRHTEPMRREIARAAETHQLLITGGSDWHGGDDAGPNHGRLGDIRVPLAWARAVQDLARGRRPR